MVLLALPDNLHVYPGNPHTLPGMARPRSVNGHEISIIDFDYGEKIVHLTVDFARIKRIMRYYRRKGERFWNWRVYEGFAFGMSDEGQWVLSIVVHDVFDRLDGTKELPMTDPEFWAPIAQKFRRLLAI